MRDKFLTVVMGGCTQDQGYYRDSGYLCCCKCKCIINGPPHDCCSGVTDFSGIYGFNKLWSWGRKQGWWPEFIRQYTDGCVLGVACPEHDYLDPNTFADAVYKFLKER